MTWIRKYLTWIQWIAGLAVLSWVIYQNQGDFLRLKENGIDWFYLTLAFILCTSSIVLTFVRWYLLVWALEFPFHVKDALRLGFIGFLCNYIAPGGAGGDLIKAAMIAQQQSSRRAVAVATILLDRVLGMLALFIVAAGACLIPTALVALPEFRIFIFAAWTGAIVGSLGLVFLMLPALLRWKWVQALVKVKYVGKILGDLINAVRLYQEKRNIVVLSVAMSIVGHFGILSSFYCCALATNPAGTIPGYVAHLQFIPMAELFSVLIPSPGGVGALEFAINYFYEMVSAPGGILTALAYRSLTIVIACMGAFYYLTSKRNLPSEESQAEPLQETATSAEN